MGLTCREIPDKASTYIDGEDKLADRLALALHTSFCPACRTYVRSLRVTRRLARASLRAEMPQALKERLASEDRTNTSKDLDR